MSERLAIAGSGAIACGLAAAAARHAPTVLWARSDRSAERAHEDVARICGRLSGEVNATHVSIVTDLQALSQSTFVVEAIIEDEQAKAAMLADLATHLDPETVLATTTSSLSIERLGAASGRPERFVGLHVFNPVARMKLVELAFPAAVTARTRARARALCLSLGKTPVEVPDIPGFVVNRLLFPYLFGAVTLMEQTGLAPQAIDDCMTLGAGHPMGPLALLDMIGLDVAEAIGQALCEPPPEALRALVAEGALGRKAGRGFHRY